MQTRSDRASDGVRFYRNVDIESDLDERNPFRSCKDVNSIESNANISLCMLAWFYVLCLQSNPCCLAIRLSCRGNLRDVKRILFRDILNDDQILLAIFLADPETSRKYQYIGDFKVALQLGNAA